MRNFIRFAVVVSAVACMAASFVESQNPDDILKSIDQFRSKSIEDARAAGEQIDMNAINEQVLAMANEAIDEGRGETGLLVGAALRTGWQAQRDLRPRC